MKMYGIKHIKDGPLGLNISPNGDDADFCNPTTVILSRYWPLSDGPLYLVACKEGAQETINHPPAWYNSSYTNPMHRYKPEDLSIFEVDIPDLTK